MNGTPDSPVRPTTLRIVLAWGVHLYTALGLVCAAFMALLVPVQRQLEVYDDVVLMVAVKAAGELGSRSELRKLTRRKTIPGSVLFKYFRNIPKGLVRVFAIQSAFAASSTSSA